eukprot:scaffold5995_cov113-Cylindrotheca_fusiformis.AAC.2
MDISASSPSGSAANLQRWSRVRHLSSCHTITPQPKHKAKPQSHLKPSNLETKQKGDSTTIQ